jgi:hypothetical protein
MPKINTDIPVSLELALKDEIAKTGTDESSIVITALAQYLKTPVHTLFQVSTSGALALASVSGERTCRIPHRSVRDHLVTSQVDRHQIKARLQNALVRFLAASWTEANGYWSEITFRFHLCLANAFLWLLSPNSIAGRKCQHSALRITNSRSCCYLSVDCLVEPCTMVTTSDYVQPG